MDGEFLRDLWRETPGAEKGFVYCPNEARMVAIVSATCGGAVLGLFALGLGRALRGYRRRTRVLDEYRIVQTGQSRVSGREGGKQPENG